MRSRHNPWLSLADVVVVMTITLSACVSPTVSRATEEIPEGTYAVDAIFREFYDLLGGEEYLGYAISPLFTNGPVQMQYTENALLRYDPNASSSQQYSLAPLGVELGMSDPPMVLPEQNGIRIVDGYVIYDEFVGVYDRMQGSRFVGKPLTQVRINSDRQRIEQYFANVGFYRLLSDPPGKVHLLAYGAWKCDLACRTRPPANAIVSRAPYFAEPMVESLNRWGSEFTGRPISPPYTAADGMLEQVYENIVAFANPNNIRLVRLRPLPEEVGIRATPLVAANQDERLKFYPLDGKLGHNVPVVFENYIVMHGGMETAGAPITEIYPEGKIYRQCFTNYCLDYDPNAASELRVRPAALGPLYLARTRPQPAMQSLTSDNVILRLWVAKAMTAPGEEQVVNLEALERKSDHAIANAEAVLEVTAPDGSLTRYHFPPTGEDGRSSVVVPAVKAESGSMVALKACLNGGSDQPPCAEDSYVIWKGG